MRFVDQKPMRAAGPRAQLLDAREKRIEVGGALLQTDREEAHRHALRGP